jgi:hypothetical protein
MEASWHVDFTNVELAGGMELATPVEKTTVGSLEKAAAGPGALEGRGGQEAWWRGRKTGCCDVAWRSGGAVESVAAVSRRPVAALQ